MKKFSLIFAKTCIHDGTLQVLLKSSTVLPNPEGPLSTKIVLPTIIEAVNKLVEKVVNVHMESGSAPTNDNSKTGNKRYANLITAS